MLKQPVEFAHSALRPVAVLNPPVVLLNSEMAPTATLLGPVVFVFSAQSPTAVFLSPVVFEARAHTPTATLPTLVFTGRALQPRAALVAVVQPRTMPATVGVAELIGGVVNQHSPVAEAAQATRT